MQKVNFAYLTGSYSTTPPQLVGVYPLGDGGMLEVAYRHYFEVGHFKKIIHLDKEMNVLELGSGNGRWIRELAPLVKHYTAVDLTPEAVAIARDMASKNNIGNVTFHEMSISDFKGDRPYDLIYFSGVSQFLQDDVLGHVIRNLNRWTKPSTLILDRSTLGFPARSVTDTATYFSIYRTSEEMDEIFSAAGFLNIYRKPSYRYLRGARLMRRRPEIERRLMKIISLTRPLSLYAMLLASYCADLARPVRIVDRGWSHDFSLFRKI